MTKAYEGKHTGSVLSKASCRGSSLKTIWVTHKADILIESGGCARGEGICCSLLKWGGITSGHHFLSLSHGLFCFVLQNMLAGASSGY